MHYDVRTWRVATVIMGELFLHLLEVEDWRQKSYSERPKKCVEAKTCTERDFLRLLTSFSKLWVGKQGTSKIEDKINKTLLLKHV